MSFKREGDDGSQLNLLKKRRVADLLSNFIPDDEATLLNNGRYTCLVCSYRPVFDTVDTLTVHRNGKKHLAGLKSFYGRKAQLRHEITKRRQQNCVQEEEEAAGQEAPGPAPLLAQTRKLTRHALLKTVPYNSCHRTTSTKSEKGRTSVDSGVGARNKTEEVNAEASVIEADKELNTSHEVKASEPITAERRKELEHYLKMKSDGWVQDWSGRWIKDQNVEFDSDEEEEEEEKEEESPSEKPQGNST